MSVFREDRPLGGGGGTDPVTKVGIGFIVAGLIVQGVTWLFSKKG